MLAESIKGDATGELCLYRYKIRRIKRDITVKHLKSRLIYHPRARGLILNSGLMSLGRFQ